ncbi:HpaA family protein [Helicobacter cetorum]|uniref:HpaA family protein n=1 Tax=Helicobacter cetorum TaxID=138563 RepID=UPI001315601D|nr:HpaA family protein [Helicobacter cetorum]
MKKIGIVGSVFISLVFVACAPKIEVSHNVPTNFTYKSTTKQEVSKHKSVLLLNSVQFKGDEKESKDFSAKLKENIKHLLQNQGYDIVEVSKQEDLSYEQKQNSAFEITLNGELDIAKSISYEDSGGAKLSFIGSIGLRTEEGKMSVVGVVNITFLEPLSNTTLNTFSIKAGELNKETYAYKHQSFNGTLSWMSYFMKGKSNLNDKTHALMNNTFNKLMQEIDNKIQKPQLEIYEKNSVSIRSKIHY